MPSKPLTFPQFWSRLFAPMLMTLQIRHIFRCMVKGIYVSAKIISASGESWSNSMIFWPPRTVTFFMTGLWVVQGTLWLLIVGWTSERVPVELPLPAWKPLLPVAREQEEGDEKVCGTEIGVYGMWERERPIKANWSDSGRPVYTYTS